MRFILVLIICTITLDSFSQNIYVPDDAFEQELINLGLDNMLDDSIARSAIDTLTFLNIAFPQSTLEYIYDLTGIEYFTSLEYFSSQTQFISGQLDLTNSPNLKYLNCAEMDLTSLLFVESSQIEYIRCDQNNISFLQVANCSNLEILRCSQNLLSNLDVSNCTALSELNCSANQLSTIDISNNTNIETFQCSFNNLSLIDVSSNINLKTISCSQNPITSIDLTDNYFLENVDVSFCNISTADIRNGNNTNIGACNITFRGNPSLNCINVDDVIYSNSTWNNSCFYSNIDGQMYYEENCQLLLCDSLIVADVVIDYSSLTIDIAIYNSGSSSFSYPYVAFTLDANGDTIQQGDISLFGPNFDTTIYNYSLFPVTAVAYPLNIYFVYYDLTMDTCVLTYSPAATNIINLDTENYKRFIGCLDFLGRKTNNRERNIYLYLDHNGKIEKRIVIN